MRPVRLSGNLFAAVPLPRRHSLRWKRHMLLRPRVCSWPAPGGPFQRRAAAGTSSGGARQGACPGPAFDRGPASGDRALVFRGRPARHGQISRDDAGLSDAGLSEFLSPWLTRPPPPQGPFFWIRLPFARHSSGAKEPARSLIRRRSDDGSGRDVWPCRLSRRARPPRDFSTPTMSMIAGLRPHDWRDRQRARPSGVAPAAFGRASGAPWPGRAGPPFRLRPRDRSSASPTTPRPCRRQSGRPCRPAAC